MKSGFVSLIGRPNVGKSTLLNSIVGKKVAITSDKPQTTRNIIQGIYNEEDTQIVFVDTPGIHKPNHKLGKYLNKQAYYSIDDVDIVLMLVDASQPLGPGDKFIIERLQNVDKPVILIINKIDKLTRDELMEKIVEYKDLYDFKEIIPVSALKKKNVNEVVKVLKEYLPDSVKFYGDHDITNKSMEFLLGEIIREKVFELTEEEVPHSLTCYIEHVEKNKNNNYVLNGVIVVDRDSLKSIIIGKQGRMIKEIGMRARKDMEELLGRKVYLELYVKVIKKWRDREKYLSEFGFNEFE
ncbi:MAG: GTPase Era [Tenericutes bacterium]|nr:GTPase Era [Mycoplasmatota bacterium]